MNVDFFIILFPYKYAGDAIEGHSIYVRNLPINVTVADLEQEFKRFGTIKQGGVQVRYNRVSRFIASACSFFKIEIVCLCSDFVLFSVQTAAGNLLWIC